MPLLYRLARGHLRVSRVSLDRLRKRETARNLTIALIGLIIYSKKLLNSDWLRKECSSSRGSLRASSPIWASLARTRERATKLPRSRVLARLTSLAQIGELARRLFWG